MTDIFISYSRKDKAMVSKLAEALEAQGYVVWWDHSLHGGQSFAREIHKQIDKAKCAIVVWSQASVESDWVYSEASHASNRGILLTTVYQDASIPLPYNTRHNEDLRGWNGKTNTEQFQKLLSAIEKYCPIPSAKTIPDDATVDEQPEPPAKPKPRKINYLVVALGILGVGAGGFLMQKSDDPAFWSNLWSHDVSHPVVVEKPTRLPFEPEMVKIPAGTFTMGCVAGRDDVKGDCYDSEKPAHEVTISKDFSIGKYEVTFDEWDACTEDGACSKADDEGWGRGKRPVINVSWDDTQKYIGWLNKKTGKNYRLPTEAEWEYAARANAKTAFPWGNSISCSDANYGQFSNECKDKERLTDEVGSYSANEFGLYDTVGNVWEWTQDWYGQYSPDAIRDPEGAQAGAARVVRGGSWLSHGRNVRSAIRGRLSPANRGYDIGFRLALGH